MSARGSKVLLEIAGAWWVGWCLSAWQQQSTTPEMLSVLPDLAFCVQKKIIQAFLGVFEKKSGANVSKLYSTARGCSEVATRRSVDYDKFWVHRFKIKN
jgi:hypothetical protein